MHFFGIFSSKNFDMLKNCSIFAVGIGQITNFAAKLQKKIDIYKKINNKINFVR